MDEQHATVGTRPPHEPDDTLELLFGPDEADRFVYPVELEAASKGQIPTGATSAPDGWLLHVDGTLVAQTPWTMPAEQAQHWADGFLTGRAKWLPGDHHGQYWVRRRGTP